MNNFESSNKTDLIDSPQKPQIRYFLKSERSIVSPPPLPTRPSVPQGSEGRTGGGVSRPTTGTLASSLNNFESSNKTDLIDSPQKPQIRYFLKSERYAGSSPSTPPRPPGTRGRCEGVTVHHLASPLLASAPLPSTPPPPPPVSAPPPPPPPPSPPPPSIQPHLTVPSITPSGGDASKDDTSKPTTGNSFLDDIRSFNKTNLKNVNAETSETRPTVGYMNPRGLESTLNNALNSLLVHQSQQIVEDENEDWD
ncbi:unnamed protein product [Hydatigera taeniaeformis]|uniref:WH2 domain-containing protein n=1 Tax=Hydatigena taeniaeformis TaxID=6205 RepID=A0A3P7E7X8_HYDTA|nr:unnamed protein product [Hydatigera taeniaeformis]